MNEIKDFPSTRGVAHSIRKAAKLKTYQISKDSKLTRLTLIGILLLCAETAGAGTVTPRGVEAQAASNPAAGGAQNENANPAQVHTAKTIEESLPVFATVGKMSITWVDYNNEYADLARKRFYHGKPKDDDVAAFQREVADTLVTNAMLVQEAKRRKLKPDPAFVKRELDRFDKRFAKDPNWPKARPRVIPILTERFKNESLRNQVEPLVRKVKAPSTKQLRQYYAAHQEKFTVPAHQRVSIILLRVDPGAPGDDWQKAKSQAQDLVKRLHEGEDFAQLAREYSGDRTAENGGDMGYLHEGMLPGLPSAVLSKLKPGEISDPVSLMEGIAIFRLTERQPAKLNSFKKARQSVRELWMAEQSDKAWNSLVAKLKKDTPVKMDESHFLPLPSATEKPAGTQEANKP